LVPLLLLAAGWFFIFRQLRAGPNSPQQQALAELKRHNEALEKILAGHVRRLGPEAGGPLRRSS